MPAAITTESTFRRGQRVLVSYGAVKVMQAHGRFAVSGYVRKRVARRPDWFEIDLSIGTVDVGERLVTAHRFALTREACEAAGRHIPLVVENVRGAQKWVGRARWNFGSFYLWGDVPALMPVIAKATKVPGMGAGWRPPGHPDHKPGLAFNTHADRAIKNGGGSWFNIAHNTTSGKDLDKVYL